MKLKYGLIIVLSIILAGCGKPQPPKEVVLKINDYEVTTEEFEDAFAQSPYALREDKAAARKEYLDNLVNQKVIVQDAIKKNLDKKPDFLRSVERFWEQSLLTVALGEKTKEINGSMRVHDENVKRLYDQMIREGVTNKTYEEMYPQIKWQAARQLESQRLNDWIEALRKQSDITINQGYLKKIK